MKRVPMSVIAVVAALSGVAGAAAAVFTVGPGGTHATVQAAVDAALTAGGANEVRVARGTFAENVTIPTSFTSGSLTLSGGWNAGFTARVLTAGATVIGAAADAPCLDARPHGGTLVVEGLTFTHTAPGTFGGVYLALAGGAAAQVHNCRAVENTVTASGGSAAQPAGMAGSTQGTSHLVVSECEFSRNSGTSEGGPVSGAGLTLVASNTSHIEAHHNVIADNSANAPGNQVTGAGLFVEIFDSSTADISDNLVAGNRGSVQIYGMLGSGASFWAAQQSTLTARRNAFVANGTTADTGNAQCEAEAGDSSTVVLGDALVAGGVGPGTGGVQFSQYGTSTLHAVNVTAAGNSGAGIRAYPSSGVLTVANSIITGNGPYNDIGDAVVISNTMLDGDPRFVAPAHLDYRLGWGSPAIDAGSDAPPGGLGATDLAGGVRTVGAHVDQGAFEYHTVRSRIPVVSHASGFGGTPWRTTLVETSVAAAQAACDLTFAESGSSVTVGVSAPPGAAVSFPDAVVDPLGFASSEQHSGSLAIVANSPGVVFSSRTFADPGGGHGTYGQFLAPVGDAEMLGPGTAAFLPLVRSDAGFYSNVGMVNGSAASCTGRVRLFDAAGAQIGSSLTMTAGPYEWKQISDVFAVAGAGSHSAAYAVVDVTSAGGAAWFYASVIDRTTKDPTTVPMQHAFPAGTVLRLPAAAHVAGAGGTPWRTMLGVVNAGGGAASVSLLYRSGATTVARSASIAAGAAAAWDDLLVGLFGYAAGANTSGSVELWADQPIAVAGRSFADNGSAGTYGQFLPALAAGQDGTGHVVAGVLTQLRKDGSFYTNVGFQNLGNAASDVRVTLFDAAGAPIGSPLTRTVPAAQWLQVNDVFAAAGAGGAAVAYAVVEVVTPGGRVWAYASVIDSLSRDPTTVPLARPWVIGPPAT